MNANETAELIQAAGGDTAFARLLGLAEHPGYLQRVNNWKRRGIPARVVLEHQATLASLRQKAQQQAA